MNRVDKLEENFIASKVMGEEGCCDYKSTSSRGGAGSIEGNS